MRRIGARPSPRSGSPSLPGAPHPYSAPSPVNPARDTVPRSPLAPYGSTLHSASSEFVHALSGGVA